MRAVVVLSGDLLDDRAARIWLEEAAWVVCADGGARHLRRLDRLPDLVLGDLDSAMPADLDWMKSQNVPVTQYPVDKDATDSELAVAAAVDFLSRQPGGIDRQSHEVVVLGAFGSRPDHVLANQLMAAHLADQGWRLILTDGINTLYTLAGGQILEIACPGPVDRPGLPASVKTWALSVIPISPEVIGLTDNDGLIWHLKHTTLTLGTTRAVSNRFADPAQTGRTLCPVTLSLEKGIALVIVTPED